MKTRARIESLLREFAIDRVSEPEWRKLRDALPAVSADTLRKHLVESGIAIDQPWRGIDGNSLEALQQSLMAMTAAYARHPREARSVVIAAKDKTRFSARNPKVIAEKRALKLEMVEWMLVWLADPLMFADWAQLRRGVLASHPLPTGSD